MYNDLNAVCESFVASSQIIDLIFPEALLLNNELFYLGFFNKGRRIKYYPLAGNYFFLFFSFKKELFLLL